jgi:hypothetical protein
VNPHHICVNENRVEFNEVHQVDSGMYSLCPSNQRWRGKKRIKLDIRCELLQ